MKQKQDSVKTAIQNKQNLLSAIKDTLGRDFGNEADFGDDGPKAEFLGVALDIRGVYVQEDNVMLRITYDEGAQRDMLAAALENDALDMLVKSLGKLKEIQAAKEKEEEKGWALERGRTTLVINPTLFRQFKAMVYTNGRTVSSVMEEIMKEYIESKGGAVK